MVEYQHVATPPETDNDDYWLLMWELDTEGIRLLLLEPSDLS